MRDSENHAFLGDIADLYDSLHKTPKHYVEDGYPMLRVTDIKRGSVRTDVAMQVDEKTYEEFSKKYKPKIGDIVLSRVGSYGNSAITTSDEPYCLGQNTVCISPNRKKIDPYFLYYCLNSRFVLSQFDSFITGASQPTISLKSIRAVNIPLPQIKIQRRVAEILSTYDDLIENNRRRIQLLEESARMLYKEWFVRLRFPGHEHVKVVDGMPEGWERMPLGDLLTLQRGFDLPTTNRKPGPYAVFASTGINGYHEHAKVKAPGVVTGRSGSLGTIMYADEDFWPLNTTLWVKEFKGIAPLFALHLLGDLSLEQHNGGAAVPTLNRNDVHRIHVLCPPSLIHDQFIEFVTPVYVQRRILKQLISQLQNARDLLLPRLMNGAIPV